MCCFVGVYALIAILFTCILDIAAVALLVACCGFKVYRPVLFAAWFLAYTVILVVSHLIGPPPLERARTRRLSSWFGSLGDCLLRTPVYFHAIERTMLRLSTHHQLKLFRASR